MQTDTLEKTDEDLSHISPDDPDNAAHYFRKTEMDKLVFGERTAIVAVCGHILTEIYKPVNGRPVCSKCAEIYAQMRD